MHAVMSLSLLCELSFGSTVSGAGRRTWTVNSDRPSTDGSGALYSAMITTVAGPADIRGSWYGVDLGPRVTISRMCTPSPVMSFAARVRYSCPVSSSRVSPISSAMAAAPSQSRSRCCSRNAGCPFATRSPSHTPSPSTKPASNTLTTAWSLGTNVPLTLIRISALRGSST